MANVYEHVTPAMREQVLTVLERRWQESVDALGPGERDRLMEMAPQLGEYYPAKSQRKAS